MEHPTQVTVLPPAGREEQLERWGISPDRTGDHLFRGDRRGQLADDALPLGDDADADDHEAEARGFLQDGGWHAVEPTKGSERGEGTTSHRGVLHPQEHVDSVALQAAVENELGFSYAEVRSVFRQGPLSAEQRELRGRIDVRLLELSGAGGSMLELARAFGWVIKPASAKGGASCDTMERALARARKES